MALAPGTCLGAYEIVGMIGAGGMGEMARAGLGPAVRPRREGGAPLIGSTPPIHLLRTRIDRVAQTDFTVLLEGESGAR